MLALGKTRPNKTRTTYNIKTPPFRILNPIPVLISVRSSSSHISFPCTSGCLPWESRPRIEPERRPYENPLPQSPRNLILLSPCLLTPAAPPFPLPQNVCPGEAAPELNQTDALMKTSTPRPHPEPHPHPNPLHALIIAPLIPLWVSAPALRETPPNRTRTTSL